MRTKLSLLAALIVLVLAAAAPALAHHAFSAEFDNTKPLTFKGKFIRIDWINPHSWVHFEVTGPDGKAEVWQAETPPPNVLYRNGWRRDTLKIGEEIEVRGFAAKDGTRHMWASAVTQVTTGQRVLTMAPPNPGR